MQRVQTQSNTVGGPVIYAGRFSDRVAGAQLPHGCPVLDEWDVLPTMLADVMEKATALVILDPLSFPFEVMTPEQWDVPMTVVLPAGFDAGFLGAVFGAPLFGHLTFFDRVITPEGPAVWEELRRGNRWAESQRVEAGNGSLEEAVAEILAVLEAEAAAGSVLGDGSRKAIHQAQARVLHPQLVAALGARDEDVPYDVLEVGSGTGRWVPSFDLDRTRYYGLDTSEAQLAEARANFPEARFDRVGTGLGFPHEDESFDLAFCVGIMPHYPAPAKRVLLSEMWRVVSSGGRLIFLEDFVFAKSSGGAAVYPMSVQGFVELLLEATNGQVVLEHVESVRYPREDMTRGGLLAVSRLGVPRRW